MNTKQPTKSSGTGGSEFVAAERRPAVARSGESPTSNEYFPTKGRWHYEVVISRDGAVLGKGAAVKLVKGTQQFGGKAYLRMVTEVTGIPPVPDQYYRLDHGSVYAHVQGTEDKELLVLPADPREQETWSGEAPPIRQLSGSAKLHQRFEEYDCVKVSLDMTTVGFLGRESKVIFFRWFAPGVGMVKEVRVEEGKKGLTTDAKLIKFTQETP